MDVLPPSQFPPKPPMEGPFLQGTTTDDLYQPPPSRATTADLASLPIPELTDQEKVRFGQLAAKLLVIPFCPWTPNPGAQERYLLDMGKESLYGGAAGGGKSIAILMAASQFLTVPGYAALILRKSFTDLGKPGALMDIAEEWWGPLPNTKFDGQQHEWTFKLPGGGSSKVVFGALDNVNDRFKYQGAAYHFVGWDELTQQKSRDYTYVSFSRGRRPSTGPLATIPIRVRSTTNPGGTGHEWVHERFIANWEQWKMRGGPRPKRNFHPALVRDNPKLDIEEYEASLMELDPVTRAQLLKGDWNIRPDGRMFQRVWFKPVKRRDVPLNCMWVRFWDTAATDPEPGLDPDYTVGARLGRATNGMVFIDDIRRWRKDPAESEDLMRATAHQDTRRVVQAMEQDPGAAGKIVIHHARVGPFAGSNFRAVLAAGKSRGRTTTLTAGRKTPMPKILAAGPLASSANAGLIYYVADGSYDHESFLSEIEIFPDGDHDDIVDAVSGAYNLLVKMPMWGLNIGDANEAMEKVNEWRPEQIDWSPNGITGDVQQSIATKTADQIQGEMIRDVQNAFAM